ncbi:MAG: L,D-transpeptidase [Clostridiales Family XIII bacterium]|nr:L,D-transpeptidase [Clostridiales Family XIII bacterium]
MKKSRILIIVIACVAGALAAYLIYAGQHYTDRVPPGTYLAGEDVSGFSLDEARAAGQNIYDSVVMNLTLKNDSDVTSVPAIEKTLTADDIGIALDADATARNALEAASDEWFIKRVNPFIKKNVGLSVIVDDDAIAKKIKSYFKDALFKSKLPKVKYSKKKGVFIVTPGAVGTVIDTARFIAEVKAGALKAGEFEYDIHLNPLMPKISDEMANEAKDFAEKAIKTKLSFEKDGEVAYKAPKNSKASWITFTADSEGGKFDVGVDDEKVMKFLKTTASAELVTKPLPELIVREIDMESAEKEAAEKKKAAERDEEKSKKSGSDKTDDTNASEGGEKAADVKVVEPAPKGARVVRKGEEGLAIANREELAAQIEENMLAGKNIKLTPEYETIPYETEEIGADFGKWVETDLTRQVTYLWNGNKKLKTYIVSTGKELTPTITGTYKIYMKRDHHDMRGYDPIKKKNYVTEDVRYISYFEGAYAYHAAYWHNSFGTQVSQGCINMKEPEAKYLYEWAVVGTTCIIHP